MMIIKPSQWINCGWFIVGIVGMPWVLPTLVALFKIAELHFWSYIIHNDHIIEKRGIFSVQHTELTISRIKSFRFEEPFFMRLVGIGNLYIKSSEPFQPELKLWGVKRGTQIWNELRAKTNLERKMKGVKEIDVFRL